MIAPTEKALAVAGDPPTRPAGAAACWYLDGDKPYVDSLYGAAVLAMLAHATGKKNYLTIMRAFFDDASGTLWDKDAGLYYRDPTYIEKRTAGCRQDPLVPRQWMGLRGHCAHSRVPSAKRSGAKETGFDLQAHGGRAHQAPVPLTDSGGRTLTTRKMCPIRKAVGRVSFVSGLAWGINHQHAQPEDVSARREERLCRACRCVVGSDGRVEWGQQVDARPNPANLQSTHEYVTGTFLLASGEVYNLSHPSGACQT